MSDWVPDIARLQAREDDEWLRVERAFCGRLLAYAQRRTGDHQAAEDVVQETLLGAVRGIGEFDPVFTFEQYLFGICKNRTIDSLRRRKTRTLQLREGEEGPQPIELLACDTETPSAIVRGRELSARAQELYAEILRAWVEETWNEREFLRLCVIEALFSGQWRNRDAWKRFELRDETAVAGIKFRCLKRLRQLAAIEESGNDLLRYLGAAEEGDERLFDLDVRALWREKRISCPARHWIARLVAGTLEADAKLFILFHLDEMKCSWCQANKDDLSRVGKEAEIELLIERLRESTRHYLRSRRGP
ncbi:MAG: RNA polymerase sigma factor, partial [Planctomycetes bacterium]|nr:RNA polymerase sigma factor [Planctomycetota bacterium]